MAASQVVGSALVTAVVAAGSLTGWLIAATVFAVTGLLMPLVIGWGLRTREFDVQAT